MQKGVDFLGIVLTQIHGVEMAVYCSKYSRSIEYRFSLFAQAVDTMFTLTKEQTPEPISPNRFLDSSANPEISPRSSHTAIIIREYLFDNHDDKKFSNITPQRLSKLVQDQNWENVFQLGGVERIAMELKSNMESGISGSAKDISSRIEAFGSNIYSEKQFQLQRLGSKVSFVLQELIHFWAFAVGLYVLILSNIIAQADAKLCSILVVTVIFFGFISIFYRTGMDNFNRAREVEKALTEIMETQCTVRRNGQLERILSRDVVVGDVVQLDKGDWVPADGLLFLAQKNDLAMENPFMFSGSKVLQEDVHMLVTAVGMNTKRGKIMNSLMFEFKELTQHQFLFKKIVSHALQTVRFLVVHMNHINGKIYYNKDDESRTEPVKSSLDDDASQPLACINHDKIVKIVKEKNIDSLHQCGGVEGLVKLLMSDAEQGLNKDAKQLHARGLMFGSNTCPKLPQPKSRGFLQYLIQALFGDTILGVMLDAFVSISSDSNRDGWRNWWYVALLFTVFPLGIAIISAIKNYNEAKSREKLLQEGYNINVTVLREGEEQTISILQVVVGDIVCLKMGDLIPADGLFLRGHSLRVEVESSILDDNESTNMIDMKNPFLFAGSKVSNGVAHMLATAVGEQTLWHEMMTSLGPDFKNHKPIQVQLETLTLTRRIFSLVSTVSITVVLLSRCFRGKSLDEIQDTASSKMSQIFQLLLLAVIKVLTNTILVNPGSRSSSVFMGNTGSLTTLALQLLPRRFTKGNREVEAKDPKDVPSMTTGFVTNVVVDDLIMETRNQVKVCEFKLNGKTTVHNFSKLPPTVIDALCQAVGLNTSGEIYKATSAAVPEFSGSPNDKAILTWGMEELGMDMEELRRTWTPLSVEAFCSEDRRGVLIRKTDDVETVHMHWRGDVNSVLPMCTKFCDEDGDAQILNEDKRMDIGKSLEVMNTVSALQTMAFAYKPITKKEQRDEGSTCAEGNKDREMSGEKEHKLEEDGFILLGLVVLSRETRAAVEDCQNVGIKMKLVSKYNISRAKAVAIECGILGPDQNREGMVVEAEDFRKYTSEQKMEMVDRILVVAGCSSYLDKFLMVKCLKKKGEVVAVIGTGMKDVTALKAADVGFSMWPVSIQVARESADILISGKNFASVAERLKFRRKFNSYIQKLIQVECSCNITSFVVNFISIVLLGEYPLTDSLSFWLNLFAIFIGNFTLVESLVTEDVVKKPMASRNVLVATNFLWRNIIFQSIFQIAALLVLVFKGEEIVGVNKAVKKVLIYNALFLCHFLHMFNARDLQKKNVFRRILPSWLFCGSMGVSLFIHVAMFAVWPNYFHIGRLNWSQWVLCIGIAIASWFVGCISKCVTQIPAFLTCKVESYETSGIDAGAHYTYPAV